MTIYFSRASELLSGKSDSDPAGREEVLAFLRTEEGLPQSRGEGYY